MSTMYFLRNLFKATGPEQVSPHYETLSRSRRGVIFLGTYLLTIKLISQLGGWNNNNWLKSLVWHHEFLIVFYVGFMEIKHFTYLVGPKFSIFYNIYTNYELTQMANMWADCAELAQNQHLRHTKQQLEFNNVDKEYEFVKKRGLINFLTNSKLNAEASFHQRTVSMLNQIQNFEQANLKGEMRNVVQGSFDKVLGFLDDPEQAERIRRGSFESALAGMRTGQMTYEGDILLPMLEEEVKERLHRFEGMTKEEEGQLLSLSTEQKKIVGDNDRKLKNEFLAAAPHIAHGTVKNHDKYKSYMQMVQSATR